MDAHRHGSLESHVGYPQNLELLKKWLDVTLPQGRRQTVFQPGDVALVMRLKYRPNTNTKGREVDEKDFEFYRIEYCREPGTPLFKTIFGID